MRTLSLWNGFWKNSILQVGRNYYQIFPVNVKQRQRFWNKLNLLIFFFWRLTWDFSDCTKTNISINFIAWVLILKKANKSLLCSKNKHLVPTVMVKTPAAASLDRRHSNSQREPPNRKERRSWGSSYLTYQDYNVMTLVFP